MEKHLDYIAAGGAPEMWSRVDTDNIMDVFPIVQQSGLPLTIVREERAELVVVGHFVPAHLRD